MRKSLTVESENMPNIVNCLIRSIFNLYGLLLVQTSSTISIVIFSFEIFKF